ncbi:helix-turn-helix domain-containing protein [Streptomyces cucumeris]|uniref:helix-turn-helix domain-containing protein n=1 Tax=Streptomyces cucumeris TaxID=2962890 RepID=UPI003D714643
MTPNGTAIRALRQALKMSLPQFAQLTGLDRGYLSRLERGLTGASTNTVRRIAQALEVSPTDITRGDDVPTKVSAPREVPYPGTPEGELFHYTPDEAARFLPWSALQLKRKAYAREIPFNDGGKRVTFTGRDIREISEMTAVRPLAETARSAKVPA